MKYMVKMDTKNKYNTDSEKYIKSESQTYTDKSYYYKMVNIKKSEYENTLNLFP